MMSNDEGVLREADALVLPGVGAFGACMKALSALRFDELVHERVAQGTPLLGVCVGMQMLFEESEEFGKTSGLGLLRGRVRRFPDDLLAPQVGWNQVRQRSVHPLLADIEDNAFFYFVHSYFPEAQVGDCAAPGRLRQAWCDYGVRFAAAIEAGPICATQFHPEKSQKAGIRLLENFAALVKEWR